MGKNNHLTNERALLDRLIDVVRDYRDQASDFERHHFDAALENLLLAKAEIAPKH